MTIDLSKLNRKELEKLRKDIDKAIEKLAITERKMALEAAEQAAREYGFSLADLTADGAGTIKKTRKSPGKIAPKYRNPADAEQTWTGRGRQPVWVREALEAGKTLDDLTI